jgi:uncharacterized protein (TIGR03067 family)
MQASLLIGLALAVGAPGPKDAKTDPPKIEGNWVAESYVLGGKDDGRDKGVVFTFADGKIKRGSQEEVAYAVNPKTDPPQIELTPVKGKQAAIPGIYKIDGDTLVLCFTKGSSAERPTKFESPDGSRIVLFTFKRQKKD